MKQVNTEESKNYKNGAKVYHPSRLSSVIFVSSQAGSPKVKYELKRLSQVTLQVISLANLLAFGEESLKLTFLITWITC